MTTNTTLDRFPTARTFLLGFDDGVVGRRWRGNLYRGRYLEWYDLGYAAGEGQVEARYRPHRG